MGVMREDNKQAAEELPSIEELKSIVDRVPYPMFVSVEEKNEQLGHTITALNVRLLEILGYFDHHVTRFYENREYDSAFGQPDEEQKKRVGEFVSGVRESIGLSQVQKVRQKVDEIKKKLIDKPVELLYFDAEQREQQEAELNRKNVNRIRTELKFVDGVRESIPVQLVSRKVKFDNGNALIEVVVDSSRLDELRTKLEAYRGILDSEFEQLMVHELDTTTFGIEWQNRKSKDVLGELASESSGKHVSKLTSRSPGAFKRQKTEESVRRKRDREKPLATYRDQNKRSYIDKDGKALSVLLEEYGFEPIRQAGSGDLSRPREPLRSSTREPLRKFSGIVTSNFDARIPNDLLDVVKDLDFRDALLDKVGGFHCVVKIQGALLKQIDCESIRFAQLQENCNRIRKMAINIHDERFYYLWLNKTYRNSLENVDDDHDGVGLTDSEVFEGPSIVLHGWRQDDQHLIEESELEHISGIEPHPGSKPKSKLVYFHKRKVSLVPNQECYCIQVVFWEYEKTEEVRKQLWTSKRNITAYEIKEDSTPPELVVYDPDENRSNVKTIALTKNGLEILKIMQKFEGRPIAEDWIRKRLSLKGKNDLQPANIIRTTKDREIFADFFYYSSKNRFWIFAPKLNEFGQWQDDFFSDAD